jgi:uncharacterized protein HemX
VFLPHAGKPAETSVGNAEPLEQSSGFLGTLAKQLGGYVVIRHTNQSVTAVLTPEEAHFLKQQLKVRLEMIEIALVQQNETLFISSIADATQWLKKNFAENQQTEQFIGELEKLAAIQIHSQYPDVSGSLKMLKDISKLRIETDKAIFTDTPAIDAEHPQTPAPTTGQQ